MTKGEAKEIYKKTLAKLGETNCDTPENTAKRIRLSAYAYVLERYLTLSPEEYQKAKESLKAEYDSTVHMLDNLVSAINNNENIKVPERVPENYLNILSGFVTYIRVKTVRVYKKSRFIEIVV